MTLQTPHNLMAAFASAASPSGGAAPAKSASAGAASFSSMIKSSVSGSGGAGSSRQKTAQTAAQELVASTLIKPILSQMRRDPFRSKLFHGGQAEDMFGAQLDTILSDRIAARTNFSVVGAVENEITRTGAKPPAATPVSAAQVLPATTGVNLDAHG